MNIYIGGSMFGAKYSRMKFWLLSLIALLIGSFIMIIPMALEAEGAIALISWVVFLILIHVLANRIRDYGSSPWQALWAIIPFVGLFQAIYYGCKKSRKMAQEES